MSTDKCRVYVKSCRKGETAVSKAEVFNKCAAQVTNTDKDRIESAVRTEDGSNVGTQICNIVAIALLAKLTKAAEILSDLGRGKTKLLTQLKRGNVGDTVGSKFIKLTKVSGKTANYVI